MIIEVVFIVCARTEFIDILLAAAAAAAIGTAAENLDQNMIISTATNTATICTQTQNSAMSVSRC